jgi:hypothetical protein
MKRRLALVEGHLDNRILAHAFPDGRYTIDDYASGTDAPADLPVIALTAHAKAGDPDALATVLRRHLPGERA